jgi:hypothetical protein
MQRGFVRFEHHLTSLIGGAEQLFPSLMFTRDDVPFCAACCAAIDRILDLYAPRPAPGSGPAR